MFQIIRDGGIVMYPLILLSFVGFAIIIEQLIFFRKIRVDENKVLERLKTTLSKQHFDEAISICENNPSPVTNLARVAIEHRKYDPKILKDAIMDAANLEVPKLERFLSSLGTVANISPLLGLLGTILGIMDAFGILSSMQGIGDPSLLAGGISKALITTAAGIIVSVPSIIFYNYLVGKVNHIIIRLENRVNELVLLLGGK